jgi:pyruvate,water dikinase
MLLKSLFKYLTYQVFSPGTVLREKYEAFKFLLENDKCVSLLHSV